MSYNSFRNDNNGAGEFALLQFRKSNNFASVAANDLLGQILWSGYDAGIYKSASYIYCQATGAPAANVPSQLQFNTSNGTVTQLAMTIGENGHTTISTPAAAGSTLTVNGVASSANPSLVSTASVSGAVHSAASFINSNTAAASGTQITVQVQNQTTGDPFIQFNNNTVANAQFTMGIDTSASNQFTLSKNSSLGTNNLLTVTNSSNQINLPLQCSFFAYASAQFASGTGAGAGPIQPIIFDSTDHNIGSAYNTATGNFVAPVTGRYLLGTTLMVSAISAGMTRGDIYIYYGTGGKGVQCVLINPIAVAFAGIYCFSGQTEVTLNAGEIAKVGLYISGGAGNTCMIEGLAGAVRRSFFYGQLLS